MENRVRALLAMARTNREKAKRSEQRRIEAWFETTELFASAWRLATHSDAELTAVDRRWEALTRPPAGSDWPDATSSRIQRIDLAALRNERDKARRLIDEGMTRSPEDGSIFMVDFLFHLSLGGRMRQRRSTALLDKRSKDSMVLMAAAILGSFWAAFARRSLPTPLDDNYPIRSVAPCDGCRREKIRVAQTSRRSGRAFRDDWPVR